MARRPGSGRDRPVWPRQGSQVHISDLHSDPKVCLEERLPEIIGGLRPDVVVVTGDGTNSMGGLEDFRACMRSLKHLHEKFGMMEKRLPVLAKAKARKSRYYLSDNFLIAWLAALKPSVDAAHFRPPEQLVERADGILEDVEGHALERLVGKLYEERGRNSRHGARVVPSVVGPLRLAPEPAARDNCRCRSLETRVPPCLAGMGVGDSELEAEVDAFTNMPKPIARDRWPMGALVGFGAGPMAAPNAARALPEAGWLGGLALAASKTGSSLVLCACRRCHGQPGASGHRSGDGALEDPGLARNLSSVSLLERAGPGRWPSSRGSLSAFGVQGQSAAVRRGRCCWCVRRDGGRPTTPSASRTSAPQSHLPRCSR